MLANLVTRLRDRFGKPPTPQAFAERLIATLRASGDTRTWRHEDEKGCLVQSDAPSNIINLHNLFRDYAAAKPSERDTVLKRQANAMMQHEIPTDFAAARAKLRPVIRSATERCVATLQLAGQPGITALAFRPLCENIEIGIAYDGEFNIARLPTATLDQWGVSFDEACDIAIDNLRAESSKPWAALPNGVFLSQFDDSYDAARLLLTDLLHRQPIAGAPVVMAPNRAVLLLTGDRNPAGLAALVDLAEQAQAQPRPLPPLMLRWDGAAWQRFVPAGLEAKLHALRIGELAGDYQDQRMLLNDVHERDGTDIFVATYSVYKRQDGSLFSVGVWSDGVPSLLPETDIVALHRGSTGQSAYVPLAELLHTCGDLMTATVHRPVRYEVKAFPDDTRFAALLARFSEA
ncbi:hypothetical protein [Burkholderia contaminans]|uniref:hypothetical protein n=1 Tax=Burkholderia contaminans TaxID=488447 RepID=UPI0008F49ACE|nr:hypothetical protein [Burkholderia contaminans]